MTMIRYMSGTTMKQNGVCDPSGLEGYMIDARARATYTSGFERYVLRV